MHSILQNCVVCDVRWYSHSVDLLGSKSANIPHHTPAISQRSNHFCRWCRLSFSHALQPELLSVCVDSWLIGQINFLISRALVCFIEIWFCPHLIFTTEWVAYGTFAPLSQIIECSLCALFQSGVSFFLVNASHFGNGMVGQSGQNYLNQIEWMQYR